LVATTYLKTKKNQEKHTEEKKVGEEVAELLAINFISMLD
jgi:hypothetical protein